MAFELYITQAIPPMLLMDMIYDMGSDHLIALWHIMLSLWYK